MKRKVNFVRMSVASAALMLAFASGLLCLAPLRAQSKAPRFVVDPLWPKPLPNLWVTGGIGGLCIDSKDHVFILNRRDLADNDLDAGRQAPVVIEFDPEGNVVNSFGDPDGTPNTPHGCAVDMENNLWVTGTGDGIVQKYSHDGSKLLLQIGKHGVVDSSDGTVKGKALNSSHSAFFKPAGIAIDPKNGDVYVADGETPGGNHRIAVFDRGGQFLRQWDLRRADSDGDTFIPVLHCVTLGNDGLVCMFATGRGHQIQRCSIKWAPNFQKNIPVEFEAMSKLRQTGRNTFRARSDRAVWIGFSRDPEQKFMYVINQDNEKIDILDRASGNTLSSLGRVGRQPGEFTYAHFSGSGLQGKRLRCRSGNRQAHSEIQNGR